MRKALTFARAFGGKDRVEWMRTRACIACGKIGYAVSAHITTGGKGRRADAKYTVPLCDGFANRPWPVGKASFVNCHTLLDDYPWLFRAFLQGLDLEAAAQRTEAAWQFHVNSGALEAWS